MKDWLLICLMCVPTLILGLISIIIAIQIIKETKTKAKRVHEISNELDYIKEAYNKSKISEIEYNNKREQLVKELNEIEKYFDKGREGD